MKAASTSCEYLTISGPILIVVCMAGIVLTNDGNAILREIDVSHPAAKVLLKVLISSSRCPHH